MRQTLTAIAAILLAAAPLSGVEFSGANRLSAWLSQPGYSLQYKEQCDLRLSGAMANGLTYTAGIRYLQDEERWEDTVMVRGITKRFVGLERKNLSLRLGNSYATLGKGLVFSCLNDDRVKLDRDLDGALAAGSYGGIVAGRVAAGRIRQNTVDIGPRTNLAGEVVLTPLGFVSLSGLYFRADAADQPDDPSLGKPAEEAFGGNATVSLGPVELSAEYAARQRYGVLDPTWGWIGAELPVGHAFYGAASLPLAGLGLSLEYKDYIHFDTPYNAPPPCNRDGRLLNSAADERGFAADVTSSLIPGLDLHGNYSKADTRFGNQEWEDSYAEARWTANSRLTLTAEAQARREVWLQPDIPLKHYRGLTLGSVLRYGNGSSVSAKVGGTRYRNHYGLADDMSWINTPIPGHYDGATAELGWSPLTWLNVAGSIEFASHRVPEYNNQVRWGMVELMVTQGNQKLMLSAGQTKGGLVCSGGFCRYEPAFRGMKCTWEWRF